ncbi:MAG: hypothetical protein WAL71_19265 [Terriglobales bacterium]|jgi:hypothetical protein
MTDRQGQSREEWEQQFIDVQHSLGPAEGLRASQIIAKKLSASPAPIRDFAHLVRLPLSGIFLVGAFLVFSSDISHKTALGLAALAAGCWVGVAAFRWPHKQG